MKNRYDFAVSVQPTVMEQWNFVLPNGISFATGRVNYLNTISNQHISLLYSCVRFWGAQDA